MTEKLEKMENEELIAFYNSLSEEWKRGVIWLLENFKLIEQMSSSPSNRKEWQRFLDLAKENKDIYMEILLRFQDFRGYVIDEEAEKESCP